MKNTSGVQVSRSHDWSWTDADFLALGASVGLVSDTITSISSDDPGSLVVGSEVLL